MADDKESTKTFLMAQHFFQPGVINGQIKFFCYFIYGFNYIDFIVLILQVLKLSICNMEEK